MAAGGWQRVRMLPRVESSSTRSCWARLPCCSRSWVVRKSIRKCSRCSHGTAPEAAQVAAEAARGYSPPPARGLTPSDAPPPLRATRIPLLRHAPARRPGLDGPRRQRGVWKAVTPEVGQGVECEAPAPKSVLKFPYSGAPRPHPKVVYKGGARVAQ